MKKLSIQIAILTLIIVGCKTKTESNNQSKTADTVQGSNNKKEISKIIHIIAKPDSVAIDASKTAVIVVDMENDCVAKGGAFDRAGIDISPMRKTINPIAEVLVAARKSGIKVIYLSGGFQPDLSDLGAEGSFARSAYLSIHTGDTLTAPDGSKSRILIRNTWGSDIISELKPSTDDILIYKTRFSGFYKTNLDSTLKQLGKKFLIVIGCTTSICVESTVRDAMFRDYSTVVLGDCTAEPDGAEFSRSNHEASLFIIQKEFGWVSNSEEFIKALKVQSGSSDRLLQ